MLRNLHIKLAALALAVVFWVFVVSLENTFYRFPQEIPVQTFNQSPDLALGHKIPGVHVAIRADDAWVLKTLSQSDFEAYVDLKNAGAGVRELPVFVTSKNPSVSVMRVIPQEVEVALEPVREKIIAIRIAIEGQPAKGYRVGSSTLSRATTTVSGAENVLKKLGEARAKITLDGTERGNIMRKALLLFYDQGGNLLDEVQKTDSAEISAAIQIVEAESTRQVGVRAVFSGALANGVVKKITVDPAVITLTGPRDALDAVEVIATEPIDLAGALPPSGAPPATFEKKAKLVLPAGVQVQSGKSEVTVKVEIEKIPSS